MTPLQDTIEQATRQVSDYLTAQGKATSWQLKLKFGLSSSVLYLVLGTLLARKQITLEADGINYNITWGVEAVQKQEAQAANPFQPSL